MLLLQLKHLNTLQGNDSLPSCKNVGPVEYCSSVVLSFCVHMQLMVANTVDGSYVFCGEVGGSVVNALHLGRDPRGKQPFLFWSYLCLGCRISVCAAQLHGLRSPSSKVV